VGQIENEIIISVKPVQSGSIAATLFASRLDAASTAALYGGKVEITGSSRSYTI
jgi:hypothetical protein